MTHVLAIFFIGWGAAYVASFYAMGLPFRSISQLLLSGATIGGGGLSHWPYDSWRLSAPLNWFGRTQRFHPFILRTGKIFCGSALRRMVR